MSRIIGLDCNLGLANRTRVLDCVLDLAHIYDKELVLYWPKDSYLYCDFEELFELPERVIKVVSFDLLHSLMHRLLRRIQKRAVHLLYSRVYRQQDVERIAAEENFDCILENRKPYLDTVTRLYVPEHPYRYLSPAKPLQEEIDTFTRAFGHNVIGIHIRRGDNFRSIHVSPLDLFVARMHVEIDQNSRTQFFLATDDPNVEKLLNELFPGHMLIRKKKSLARSEPAGVQDALIDLYCLAKTQKILGSFHSSFSEEAALLGGIKLEVIKC